MKAFSADYHIMWKLLMLIQVLGISLGVIVIGGSSLANWHFLALFGCLFTFVPSAFFAILITIIAKKALASKHPYFQTSALSSILTISVYFLSRFIVLRGHDIDSIDIRLLSVSMFVGWIAAGTGVWMFSQHALANSEGIPTQ